MSENKQTDIEKNGTENSEDHGLSDAEARDEETEEGIFAEVAALKKQNEQLEKSLEDEEAYRKRLEKQTQDKLDLEKRQMLGNWLPVLDSFEAIDFKPHWKSKREHVLREKINKMKKRIFTVLEESGVAEIPSGAGVAFDPSYHEAFHKEYSEAYENGTIISEFRKGYLLNGRRLRASWVSVSQGPEKEPEEDSEEKTG